MAWFERALLIPAWFVQVRTNGRLYVHVGVNSGSMPEAKPVKKVFLSARASLMIIGKGALGRRMKENKKRPVIMQTKIQVEEAVPL